MKEQQTVSCGSFTRLQVQFSLIHLPGTKVTKTVDGYSNKGFILTMNNGSEVWVKIPNPHTGPARYTVASEVATRDLEPTPVDEWE